MTRMSKSWKQFSMGVSALVLVVGLVGSVAAQPGPGAGPAQGRHMRRMGPGEGPFAAGGMMRGLRGLDLTDAQRDQVRAIQQKHREEFQAIAKQSREAQQELHAAITAESFNEGAVRAASAKLADVNAERAVLQARAHQEIWSLLTPEQKEKAKSLKAEREQRLKERRDRVDQRLKNRPGAAVQQQ